MCGADPLQEGELQRLTKAREQELLYQKQVDLQTVEKTQKLAQIETQRFRDMMTSLGSETLSDIARAGPEMQVTP